MRSTGKLHRKIMKAMERNKDLFQSIVDYEWNVCMANHFFKEFHTSFEYSDLTHKDFKKYYKDHCMKYMIKSEVKKIEKQIKADDKKRKMFYEDE